MIVYERRSDMASVINDRIDIRISKEQKQLIKYAADLKGFKSLSEFVVFCVNNEATKIVQENELVLKTLEDKKIFLDTILNPPAPNAKLIKAFRDYGNLIDSDEA